MPETRRYSLAKKLLEALDDKALGELFTAARLRAIDQRLLVTFDDAGGVVLWWREEDSIPETTG